MTVEYIRYQHSSHTADAFVTAYVAACKCLDAAPECLGYELSRCDEEGSSFVLRIDWTSAEAHMQGFRKGPHFGPFLAAIGPFVPEIVEMRHFSVVPECARRRKG